MCSGRNFAQAEIKVAARIPLYFVLYFVACPADPRGSQTRISQLFVALLLRQYHLSVVDASAWLREEDRQGLGVSWPRGVFEVRFEQRPN